MTENIQNTAEALWSLLLHHALPADVAIASLQEIAGGPDQAVSAIITRGVLDAANTRPPALDGSRLRGSWADVAAGTIGGAMLLGQFDQAEADRKALAHRMVAAEVAGHVDFTGPWLAWCARMSQAIQICRALVAAVKPKTPTEVK